MRHNAPGVRTHICPAFAGGVYQLQHRPAVCPGCQTPLGVDALVVLLAPLETVIAGQPLYPDFA